MIIFNAAIVFLIVLSLAGTSGLFSERSGTVNIGINGMMLFGMIGYFLSSKTINGHPELQIVLSLIAAMSGALIGILFGFMSITLKANQIIAGTAINLLAAALGLFLLAKFPQQDRNIGEPTWAVSTDASSIKAMFSIILFIGIIVLLISYIALKFTPWGLRLKAAGENPQALDSQGINVIMIRYHGVIISGILAGLAGGFMMQNAAIFSGNVKGLGFVGLAILISGQWRFEFVIVSAIIFSGIYSVAENIVVIKVSLSKIQPLIQTIPFILSLIALGVFSKASNAPASVGLAYDKSKR